MKLMGKNGLKTKRICLSVLKFGKKKQLPPKMRTLLSVVFDQL